MAFFPALWNVPPSGSTPGTVSQIYIVAVHPQGVQAAPVGSIAIRTTDGQMFVKRGGGTTAYGWYLPYDQGQSINWAARWFSGASQMTAGNAQNLSVGPSTIINFPPTISGGATIADPQRGYSGGYTNGVALNTFLWRYLNNMDSAPAFRIDGAVTEQQEFDLFWDVFTTPRSSSVAASTDLTTGTMRIWAGGVWGAAAVQAVGATASSDAMQTEWPSALPATDGMFGMAFRFSSAVDAGTWQVVTCNRVAGVYAQTVTPMSAIAANTFYRLRLRMQLIAGVPTVLASINDGTEVAITGNVGSGGVPAGAPNQTQPFQPLASIRTVNGTVKSLCVSQCALWYGAGNGVTT